MSSKADIGKAFKKKIEFSSEFAAKQGLLHSL